MKTEQEYLKKPEHCPHCNSDEAGQLEHHEYIEATKIITTLVCPECSKEWQDVYTLTGMIAN